MGNIADWDTSKLARFVEDMIRTNAPAALVNISAEDVTVTESLNVADQIAMSPQALDYIRAPVMYSSVEALQTTASTSYTNLTTVGPSITFPLAGKYMLGWGADCHATAAAEAAYCSFDATDANSVRAWIASGAGNTQGASAARLIPFTATQGQTLTLTYRSVVGSTVSFEKRWITAWPIPA